MRSVFFDAPNLNILAAPWHWKIVSSLFPPDVAPSNDRAHQKWMAHGQNQHTNAHDEILIALQGCGHYGTQGKVYPCQPGSVFFFNRTDRHDTGYPPSAKGMIHIWIHLLEGSAYALVEKIDKGAKPQILCRVDLFEENVALSMLTQTWRNMRTPNEPLSKFYRSQLVAALYMVVVELVEHSLADPSTHDSFGKRAIRHVTDHVAANKELNFSIDDLALMAGYSKYHFVRLFKKHTGQTVHHFLNGCRLARATDMLAGGHRRKEVAAVLGFKHESSFSRWHKMCLDAARKSARKKEIGLY